MLQSRLTILHAERHYQKGRVRSRNCLCVEKPLNFCILAELYKSDLAGSSNGRTSVSGTEYLGSSPSPAAILDCESIFLPYPLHLLAF